jgi:hypothetical protein
MNMEILVPRSWLEDGSSDTLREITRQSITGWQASISGNGSVTVGERS